MPKAAIAESECLWVGLQTRRKGGAAIWTTRLLSARREWNTSAMLVLAAGGEECATAQARIEPGIVSEIGKSKEDIRQVTHGVERLCVMATNELLLHGEGERLPKQASRRVEGAFG